MNRAKILITAFMASTLALGQSTAAQMPVGQGAYHMCVVSQDASNTFFVSKLSTGAKASDGTQIYESFLSWLVQQGKAQPTDAGNCYFSDDEGWISRYVEHLDDGCETCAQWTLVYTDWSPAAR